MDQSPRRIERAVSGFIVIVVGVLVALWADAAWQNRMDAEREQVLLRDLLEEFSENQERLRADIEISRRTGAAGELWADAMLGGVVISDDSLATLWLQSQSWGRFDPLTGALRSVIDGGELGLVRNRELRQALAGWTDLAEEARISSRSVLISRAGQAPIALSLTPGGPHTTGELAAIRTIREYATGSLRQLLPLMESLQSIMQLIEGEVAGW